MRPTAYCEGWHAFHTTDVWDNIKCPYDSLPGRAINAYYWVLGFNAAKDLYWSWVK